MKYPRIETRVRKVAADPFTKKLIDVLSAAGYDYQEYRGMLGVTLDGMKDLMGLSIEVAKIAPDIIGPFIHGAKFNDMGKGMIIYWSEAVIEKGEFI